MKLYLECSMGAAGDMLMAALLELLTDKALFLHRMRNLGLNGVEIDYDTVTKCGVTGTKMHIRINGIEEGCLETGMAGGRLHKHERVHIHDPANDTHHDREHTHPHYKYQDICGIIEILILPKTSKGSARCLQALGRRRIGRHGVPAEQIHFHEVGSLTRRRHRRLQPPVPYAGRHSDRSFACACRFRFCPLRPRSPACPRSSHSPYPARCSHLRRKIKGELCTPTGAALLRHFVERFGDMEPITVTKSVMAWELRIMRPPTVSALIYAKMRRQRT